MVISILQFSFSCVLLIVVSARIAYWFSETRKDAFWIFAGAAYLQISSIPLFLSLFNYLTIKGFLLCQIFLTLLTLLKKTERIVFFKGLGLDVLEKCLFISILVLIVIHFLQRINLPLFVGDVLYYHASRPLYWIQNHSMAAYPTMNDRQIVFSFGTDLIFMWPVLFTKSEFIGRMVYWTGFPAAATGFYTLIRTMDCSKINSLFSVLIFTSTPIIYFFGLNLEPLIWVSFFSIGSGYWAVRMNQAPLQRLKFIFLLGLCCILTANAKNFGIALIPAGAAAIIIVQLQLKSNNQFITIIKTLGMYTAAIFTGLLLSGFGFLLIQNWMLFGNPASSPAHINQNISEFSFYQFYVHTIRIFFVLAEIPISHGDKFLMEIGNWCLHLLKADTPLPKEIEWEWVGHYTYQVPQWPGLRNFGISGIFIFLGLTLFIKSTIKGVKHEDIISTTKAILKSDKFPLFVIASTLFFSPAYILRWINSGTRSFIAPGLVCILALSLSFVDTKYITRKFYTVIFLLSLIFYTLFIIHNGQQLYRLFNLTKLKWHNINYTRLRPHQLINEHVPENAVLILLVHGNFTDYTAFGEHYTRKVIQITSAFNENKIKETLQNHPYSYLYIHKKRYKDVDFDWLRDNTSSLLITENDQARLYKFQPDKKKIMPSGGKK